ncbi:uncharacterized protein LOC106013061 [Aplysia californica]|uniref:Uncharacterized protein LOC106013061 n=1 Tax=Aplysia californica TaxID=6500 RepID=A0ABM1A981_APLCA|nr:uncharacterized protein LOC106013061 [Aplysia californica]
MSASRSFRVLLFLIVWILLLVIITNTPKYLPLTFTSFLSVQSGHAGGGEEQKGLWLLSDPSKIVPDEKQDVEEDKSTTTKGSRRIQTSDESVSGLRIQAERDSRKSRDQPSHVTEINTKQLHSFDSESNTLRNDDIVSYKTSSPSSNDVPNKNDTPTVNDTPFRNHTEAQVLESKHASSNSGIPKTTGKVFDDKLDLPRYLLPSRINDISSDKNEDEKYFIYRCDDGLMRFCGGWADRLKGILTGFLIANLTGRTFKAELLSFSCHLEKFLVPNVFNWSLPHSFHTKLERHGKSGDTAYLNMVDKSDFYGRLHLINFTNMIGPAKFAYFKANLDYIDGFKKSKIYSKQLSWMKNLSRDVVYAKLYRALFKPSSALQSRLDLFLATARPPGHRLICAHIRMGRNPSLPNDSQLRQTPEDLPAVWKHLKNQSHRFKNSKIFLMSDSDDVIQLAKNQSFAEKLVFTQGNVVHVERSKMVNAEEKCEGLEKVIFDQQILMHCDVLMISKSGISRMAAYVRQKDDGLFCLVKKEVVKCETKALKELYKVMG